MGGRSTELQAGYFSIEGTRSQKGSITIIWQRIQMGEEGANFRPMSLYLLVQ
jgi:hypothetical protein